MEKCLLCGKRVCDSVLRVQVIGSQVSTLFINPTQDETGLIRIKGVGPSRPEATHLGMKLGHLLSRKSPIKEKE